VIFVQIAIMMTDIVIMPVDLAASPPVTAPIHPTSGRIVILRRRSVSEALREAELRGAPEHELQLLEEAALAASIAGVRARLREGGTVSTAKRELFERDCELMRRFPNDRRGINGEGWFHLSS
jgi:hypothetical protein